jgi:hypothetical protein
MTLRVMRSWLLISISLLPLSCAEPATPPDPPYLLNDYSQVPGHPWKIRELEIDHGGGLGGAVYRVIIDDSGRFEYHGEQDTQRVGQETGVADTLDVYALFTWLHNRPTLYGRSVAASPSPYERVVFRFKLTSGDMVVVETNPQFHPEHPKVHYDDFWVLSNMVDGIIIRTIIRAKPDGTPYRRKPAT